VLNATAEEGTGCAWLVSPWVDLTMSGSTLAGKDSVDPLIHKTYLEELAAAYVPEEIDRADPRVSPLFANLTGFPPTLIQVGSAETLLADATRFAAAAGAADAAVTLEVWPNMIHAWHLWHAHVEAALETRQPRVGQRRQICPRLSLMQSSEPSQCPLLAQSGHSIRAD